MDGVIIILLLCLVLFIGWLAQLGKNPIGTLLAPFIFVFNLGKGLLLFTLIIALLAWLMTL